MTDLATGKTTYAYSGTSQTFTVPRSGSISFKLWGGGGGGGLYNSAGGYGGAGGFTNAQLAVTAGDVVQIDVAQGGRAATWTSGGIGAFVGSGGAAAWPDGGEGSNGSYTICGGGGGSTRIWINGVVKLVAGGGGGHGGVPGRNGGGGGGLIAEDAQDTFTQHGTGGTQSAGGVNGGVPSDTNKKGGSLQGGKGYLTSVPNRSTAADSGGGGGGGGYYGGGGGGNAGGYCTSGGGGSGHVVTGAISGSATTTSTLGSVSGNTDPDYVTGVAISGTGNLGQAGTPAHSGGDGYAVLNYDDAAAQLSFPIDESYTGVDAVYTATDAGLLTFKLWGAGGGGGYDGLSYTGDAGGGGFTIGSVYIVPGDSIKLEVGQGGRKPSNATTGGGAAWPDGGEGSNAQYTINGGGGGSTRIYINGTLVAIAGAGGGSTSTRTGGEGGGLSGLQGGDKDAQGTVYHGGYGGTQLAGGTNPDQPADTNKTGGYLQGGKGYLSTVANNGTSADSGGGGGGGGYYGGGGGGKAGGYCTGGGGGSSYILSTAINGSTTTASGKTPGGSTDSAYVSGVGVGGISSSASTTAAANGGNGHAHLTFIAGAVASIPTNHVTAPNAAAGAQSIADGNIATTTMSPPLAGATVGIPSGAIATNHTTPPAAGAVGGVGASGLVGTVVIDGSIGGQGTVEAVIEVPISDNDIFFDAPEGSVVGGVDQHTPMPGPITTTVPKAFIPGHAIGDGAIVTMVKMEGFAEQGIDVPTTNYDHPITFTAPGGTASGGATGKPPIGSFFAIVSLVPLNGAVSTPDQEVIVDFGDSIALTAIDGMAEQGIDVFTTPFANDVTLDGSALTANVGAGGTAFPVDNGPGHAPNAYLVQISNTAPNGTGGGPANIDGLPNPVVVTMSHPMGITKYSATILASIIPAELRMKAPAGHAGPALGAYADGDLADIAIVMSEVNGYVDSDQPGFAPIRFLRSLVPGKVPTTLPERSIAINENDGILYTRDGDGNVQGTPLYQITLGAELRPGGTEGQVLRGDGSWGTLTPAYDAPVRLATPTSTRIVLSEGLVGEDSVTPAKNTIFFRPFFIAKPTVVNDLGINISTAGDAVAHVGICHWNLNRMPGDLVVSADIATTATGIQTAGASITLGPGWYAAMIAVTGTGSPSFNVGLAPDIVAADFTLQGDPTAAFAGTYVPIPAPTASAAYSLAYLTAGT